MALPEKVCGNYQRVSEESYPSEGVKLEFKIEKIDGECLDTSVCMVGNFTVAGCTRKEFAEKLGELIDKYRI